MGIGEQVGGARGRRLSLFASGLRACGLALAVLVTPVHAEDDAQGAGFLPPFPQNDVYQVLVVGDNWAEGLRDGLQQSLGDEPRVSLAKKHRELDALMRANLEESLKAFDETFQKEPPHALILMLGANDRDRAWWKNASGKRPAVGSDEWREEFGRRVELVMKAARRRNIAVYWVGLPTLRRSEANDDAQMMNEIIRGRAYLNGVKYIDAFAGTGDEQGDYNDSGPDITGKIRRLREPDGVNFTDAGHVKLAHFVERELRRDLAQAKAERNIPLAGSEQEQASVNPGREPAAKPGGEKSGSPSIGRPGKAGASAVPGSAGAETKADSGRVTIKSAGADGREEIVSVDIVRPAIPAGVVALVTRRESEDKPTQLGDSLIDQIPGGLTVVTTITPAGEAANAARRRLSPTQAAYFRVLVKGERLASKAGRADDLTWPRLEPAVVPEPPAPVAAPVKASPPSKGKK